MPLYQRFIGVAPEESTCFVLMPFDAEAMSVFERIRAELHGIGFSVKNADSILNPDIMENILDGIRDAEYVIVDITGFRANVMYELGIVHSVKPSKKVIVISRDNPNDINIPFNINQQNIEFFSQDENSFQGLMRTIKKRVAPSLAMTGVPIPIRFVPNHLGDFGCVDLGMRFKGYADDLSLYRLRIENSMVGGAFMKLAYRVIRDTIDPPQSTDLGIFYLVLDLGHAPKSLEHINGVVGFKNNAGGELVIQLIPG